MKTFIRIIIGFSSLSFGIAVIAYFTGDKNKSVKDNVQDNLHFVNQDVDEGKEKIKKFSKNEEDIFFLDHPFFPFMMFPIALLIIFSHKAYYQKKNFIERFRRCYSGSTFNDLLKIVSDNLKKISNWEPFKKTLISVFITWLIGEGVITSVIYLIICLTKKKSLKYVFSHRFYFRSLGNFFLFVFYSLIIDPIFIFFIFDIFEYFIASCCVNEQEKKYLIVKKI